MKPILFYKEWNIYAQLDSTQTMWVGLDWFYTYVMGWGENFSTWQGRVGLPKPLNITHTHP